MRKAQENLQSLRQEGLEMGKQTIRQKAEDLEKTFAEKEANIEELENRIRELKNTLEKIYNFESRDAPNEV